MSSDAYVPVDFPCNFPSVRGSVRLGAAGWRAALFVARLGAMSVARPTYIRGGSINSRTSFLVRRRPVGPS